MTGKFSKRSEYIIVAVLLATYILIAVTKINFPGPHYDELIHVNAALGGIDKETFIFRSLGDWPVLLMPYVGALKSYITAPIFSLFGVSSLSVRLPMILITAAALLLTYITTKKYFGRSLSLLVLFLLALDSSFIALTRVDFGPVVLGFVAKIAAIYFLSKFIKDQKVQHLIFMIVTLGLGIYHKLDFIWFFNALVFSTAIIYFKDIWRFIKSKKNDLRFLLIGTAVTGFGALAGYYFIASKKFNLFGSLKIFEIDLAVRLQNVFSNLKYQINGELFYNNAFGAIHTQTGRYLYIALVVIALIAFILIVFDPAKLLKNRKHYFFFVLLLLTTLAQILVTKNAVWPWHTFATYPAITIITAYSLYVIYKYLLVTIKSKKAALVIGIGALIFIGGYNLWMSNNYIKIYDQPLYQIFWSAEIYNLIDYTQAEANQFVSIDWGTHNQLISFTQERDKYFNESFKLNNKKLKQDAKDAFFAKYLDSSDNFLFILHPKETTLFPVARQNFFDILAEKKLDATKEREFTDGQKVIYEIYSVE